MTKKNKQIDSWVFRKIDMLEVASNNNNEKSALIAIILLNRVKMVTYL